MLITLKTLQQQTFKVEIEENDTVLQLKEKIETSRGDQYPVGGQKLITAGKVMEDVKTLKDYKISEKGFIVVMVTKPKAPAKSEEDKSESASASSVPAVETPAATEATAPASEPAEPTPAAPAAAPTTEGSASSESVGGSLMGILPPEEYQSAVNEMMAMGFDRPQVEAAMRASFNHPDRAVEFLLSGSIPTEPVPAVVEAEEPAAVQPAVGGTGGADFIAQLQAWPQFQQMRQLVQANSNMLPQLLQHLGRTNPQLLSSIQENQEQFLEFLNSPAAAGGSAGGSEESGEDSSGGEGVPGQGGGGMPTQIRVTPQEREAIDRLKQLGFPEHLVIQAYFACDKNEDAAANFLLNEGVFDDEEYGA